MPGTDTPSLRPSGEVALGMTDRLGGLSLVNQPLPPHLHPLRR
jgi:hypothetical protein